MGKTGRKKFVATPVDAKIRNNIRSNYKRCHQKLFREIALSIMLTKL